MKIGKYELRQELGHGAMGTVYKAWDTLLERFVAIKLIGASLVFDEKRKTLFEREAKAIARMSHPNIVIIYDFNYVDEKPYIAMELLNGYDLEDLPHKDQLTIAQKLEIVLQICNGLSHAHQQEVVHRDIKPTNIFVTESGTIKIMDFGIARLTAGATMTQGTIMGTPEYMSPEQILGEKVDERSDIFAVGTLLYWLLKGESPFSAENVKAAFYKILNQAPPSLELSGLEAEQSERLQGILNKSLEKQPAERYSKASEMAQEIREFMGSLPKEEQMSVPAWEAYWLRVKATQAKKAVVETLPPLVASHPETRIEGTLRLADRNRAGSPSGPLPSPPRFQPAGKYAAVAILLVLAVAVLYARYFSRQSDSELISAQSVLPNKVRLGLSFESAKQRWMEPLVQKFENSPEGKNIDIDVITLSAMDSAEAILNGDRRISVWCPASDLLEEELVYKWKSRYGKSPILSKNEIAYTPMVFVIWEERYDPFIKKYKNMSFATIAKAMGEKDGWSAIAQKTEWGLFGFGSTDPDHSNSGIMLLLLLAHEFHRKASALTMSDVENPRFQEFLLNFKRKTQILGNTTSELIQKMLVKGPATIDAAFMFENVAIDYLEEAEGRWGKFRFVYPEYNMWNENPYCVLDAPWVDEAQQKAAKAFLDYLLKDANQKEALNRGFRPVDPEVSFLANGSPFLRLRDAGLRVDIGTTCEMPPMDVLIALQESWAKMATESAP